LVSLLAPLNLIAATSKVSSRDDLALTTHRRSSYVAGIEAKDTDAVSLPRLCFAMSLHVVAISGPLS
jgi:hypothetical protein